MEAKRYHNRHHYYSYSTSTIANWSILDKHVQFGVSFVEYGLLPKENLATIDKFFFLLHALFLSEASPDLLNEHHPRDVNKLPKYYTLMLLLCL